MFASRRFNARLLFVMATIALPRPILPHSSASDIDSPVTPPRSLEGPGHATQSQICPTALPNKHIPICPTGPSRSDEVGTPPSSPGDVNGAAAEQQRSLLFPPDAFVFLEDGSIRVYEINASQLAEALDFALCQPLPAPDLMFPWLHGLHPQNQLQLTFFMGRKRPSAKAPSCTRGILLVKTDGDLCSARLRGAVAPDEFMSHGTFPRFIDPDPADGFSVRNFQIQTAKWALVSDIVVYGEDAAANEQLAWDIATAQQYHREQQQTAPGQEHQSQFNTFMCTSPFKTFEDNHSDIVAVDSDGFATGKVLDFVQQERNEMWNMTQASEISQNVFMGPTPEPESPEEQAFDILIECSDLGRLNPANLRALAKCASKPDGPTHIEFPSSGSILPPTWSHDEADAIIETCHLIYRLSHGLQFSPSAHELQEDCDHNINDISDGIQGEPYKILIHCADGYTESTMLGIAYLSYSSGQAVPDAWLDLHTSKNRNFFAYPTDVALLTAIAPRLLQESPLCHGKSLEEITCMVREEPKWLPGLDGSLPSRVLDYLYLGNLGHANNPDLLRELGIGQILSVGETASWREGDLEDWGPENVYVVHGVQDNGIDPLTEEFPNCLDFIGK